MNSIVRITYFVNPCEIIHDIREALLLGRAMVNLEFITN
jgi:hypothetical protein